MTTSNETITIPLNKLDVDPLNVRKTHSAEGIKELAATIRADGYRLLQNLIVRKGDKKGRYFVTAGGRRRAALQFLAEAGEIAKDFPVECREREAEDATAISLTENLHEAMHPADQYEAFKAMADQGKPVADIAARFGTTEIIVNRRLALAKVSPVLMAAYRAEELSFEQLAAFTISDDHARQEEVWNGLQSWDRSAHTIKRQLTAEEVPGTDKRVAFIGGLAAYEAAGGPVRRDLFTEAGGYACDSGLLETLVLAKLESLAEPAKAEGWKWVEFAAKQPDNLYQLGRVYPQKVELSEADQAKLDQLSEEYDSLAELIEAGAADDDAEPRLAEVEKQIDALRDAEETYQAEDLAKSGAILTLDYHGRLAIHRGLVRDGDRDAQGEAGEGEGDDIEATEETASKGAKLTHSATLIEDLTAQKTAALRVELANNPDIALVAVVHAMLLRVAYGSGLVSEQSALQISLTHERLEGSMKRPDDNRALAEWESIKENYGHKITGNPADLWEWCLDQSREELLNLLAFAAAHTVNAVEAKYTGDRRQAFAHADQIGQALNVDMRDYFTPTAESYFSHLNRQSIEAAVAEVRGADFASGVSAMKKAEAAAYAEKAVKDSGWLPAHIRIPPATPDEAESAEIHPFPVAAE